MAGEASASAHPYELHVSFIRPSDDSFGMLPGYIKQNLQVLPAKPGILRAGRPRFDASPRRFVSRTNCCTARLSDIPGHIQRMHACPRGLLAAYNEQAWIGLDDRSTQPHTNHTNGRCRQTHSTRGGLARAAHGEWYQSFQKRKMRRSSPGRLRLLCAMLQYQKPHAHRVAVSTLLWSRY
jgi:hypothetical protein